MKRNLKTIKRNTMKDNSTKMQITFENEDRKLTWQSPYIDSSMEDILEAIYGMCITMTWHPYTVLETMYEFSKERLKSFNSINNSTTTHIIDGEDDEEITCC